MYTICEFNGLPGCGKSTVAWALFLYAKNSGIHTCYYTRGYSANPLVRKLQWILRITHSRIRLGASVYNSIVHLGKSAGASRRYIWDVIINLDRISNIKDAELIIVDQGLIQGILSIICQSDQQASLEPMIKQVIAVCIFYLKNCLLVHCQAQPELCLERTQLRKQKGYQEGSRAENQGMSMFLKQQQLLDKLRSAFNNASAQEISINMVNEVTINTAILGNEISGGTKSCLKY